MTRPDHVDIEGVCADLRQQADEACRDMGLEPMLHRHEQLETDAAELIEHLACELGRIRDGEEPAAAIAAEALRPIASEES